MIRYNKKALARQRFAFLVPNWLNFDAVTKFLLIENTNNKQYFLNFIFFITILEFLQLF